MLALPLGLALTVTLPAVCLCAFPCPQDIRFQAKSGRLLNRGKLNERGAITCFCRQCNGKVRPGSQPYGVGVASLAGCALRSQQTTRQLPHTLRNAAPAGPLSSALPGHLPPSNPPCPKQPSPTQDVSASEFEEHSGSKDRRPADGIFMEGAALAGWGLASCLCSSRRGDWLLLAHNSQHRALIAMDSCMMPCTHAHGCVLDDAHMRSLSVPPAQPTTAASRSC